MHACVIGAGIIGVTTAWKLASNGWQVTLVDAASEPASGTSHANGGQLSYSYVAPLAAPGVLTELPGWLLSRTSPLRFRPRWDLAQWSWCLQFMLACNAKKARASTAHMLSLSYLSRTALTDLLEQTPVEFAHKRNGKLIVYRSPKLFEKARALLQYEASLGAEQQALSADQCVAQEPTLAPIRADIAGAIYTPSGESGDCEKLARGLFEKLSASGSVSLRMQTTIGSFKRDGNAIRAAVTGSEEAIEADAFVIAAGMGSRTLLAQFGSAPPLYPLKGYSLSVPCDAQSVPAISVTDYERHTVYANLGGTLRIAAMVGIGLAGTQVEDDRIGLVRRQARELLPNLDLGGATAWAGLRPATPDGLPLIGRSRVIDNLWMNIGHGALGFTLACGSSVLLERLMARAEPPIDPAPFQPRY